MIQENNLGQSDYQMLPCEELYMEHSNLYVGKAVSHNGKIVTIVGITYTERVYLPQGAKSPKRTRDSVFTVRDRDGVNFHVESCEFEPEVQNK